MEGEYIEGSKGGGAASGVEADDTLRSRQTVRLLFAVSEGELTNTTPEVFLDKLPLGNYAHEEVHFRLGTSWQGTIPTFIDTESPLKSFSKRELKHTDGGITLEVGKLYDAIRVTFSLASLRLSDEKGNISGYTVNYKVEVYRENPSNGADPAKQTTITKTGKASTIYAFDVNVNKPAELTGQNWYVKLTRITPDDEVKTLAKESSKTDITSVIQIIYSDLSYPNTALLGLVMKDADEFGGNIPDIIFRIKGIKVRVPSDPRIKSDGTYYWDGTLKTTTQPDGSKHFQKEYSANPAWILLDILTRPVSNGGLGIEDKDIDLPSLYALGKYADEEVTFTLEDEDVTKTEPRYELHNQFASRENVPTFLMYVLTICNANLTQNEFGQISVMYDHPYQAVTKQVTNANVVDGLFTYSSNDFEARYTIANVTYNNPYGFGETITTTVMADDLILRYGLQTIDIVLAGCMSEAQAIRKARWAIYSNSITTGFVSFKLGFAGINYRIGDLINVYDNYNATDSLSGLVTEIAGAKSFKLDRVITRVPVGNWKITYYTDTTLLTVEDVTVVGDEVTLPPQTTLPMLSSLYILEDDVVSAKVYKVIKIDLEDDVYSITGSEHFEAKYNFIDEGILLSKPNFDFVDQSYFEVNPPRNLKYVIRNSEDGKGNTETNLFLNWDIPTVDEDIPTNQRFKPVYRLSYVRDNDPPIIIKDIILSEYVIKGITPSTYKITVWAINPKSGKPSKPLSQITVKDGSDEDSFPDLIDEIIYKPRTGKSNLNHPIQIKVNGTTKVTGIRTFEEADLFVSMESGGNLTTDGNDTPDILKSIMVEVRTVDQEVKATFINPVINKLIFVNNLTLSSPIVPAGVNLIDDGQSISVEKTTNSPDIIRFTLGKNIADEESYVIRGQFPRTDRICGFGLDNLEDSNNPQINYVIRCDGEGRIVGYVNGTGVCILSETTNVAKPFAVDDVYEIEYGQAERPFIRFKKNGLKVTQLNFLNKVSKNLVGQVALDTQNSKITDIVIGQYTNTVTIPQFKLKLADNRAIFGEPTREFILRFYSMDTHNDISKGVSVRFKNPPIDASWFSFTVKPISEAVIVTIKVEGLTEEIKASRESSIDSYCVWQSLVEGYNPALHEPIYRGTAKTITLAAVPDREYNYWVSCSDKFSRTDLDISEPTKVTVRVATALVNSVVVTEGLNFRSVYRQASNKVIWDSGEITNNNTNFVYRIASGWADVGNIYQYFYVEFNENDNTYTTDTAKEPLNIQTCLVSLYNTLPVLELPNVRLAIAMGYVSPLGGWGASLLIKESTQVVDTRNKERTVELLPTLDIVSKSLKVSSNIPTIVLEDKNNGLPDVGYSSYILNANNHVFSITGSLYFPEDSYLGPDNDIITNPPYIIEQSGIQSPLRIDFDDKSLSVYGEMLVKNGDLLGKNIAINTTAPQIVMTDITEGDGSIYTLVVDQHNFSLRAKIGTVTYIGKVDSATNTAAPLFIDIDSKSVWVCGNQLVDEGSLTSKIANHIHRNLYSSTIAQGAYITHTESDAAALKSGVYPHANGYTTPLGTSNGFLKADGSVQTSTNLTYLGGLLDSATESGVLIKSFLGDTALLGLQRISSSGLSPDDAHTIAVRNSEGSCAFYNLKVNGGLNVDGNTVCTVVKYTSLVNISDERLKNITKPIVDVLPKLSKLNPTYFTYNDKYFNITNVSTLPTLGLLAQEVEVDFPEAVTDDSLTDSDGINYKGVDYTKLIPVLIQAIKELNAKVDFLTDQVNNYAK
jgi:predicted phage tail protein